MTYLRIPNERVYEIAVMRSTAESRILVGLTVAVNLGVGSGLACLGPV